MAGGMPDTAVQFDFEARPWLRFYGPVPHTLEYPDKSMYEMLLDTGRRQPDETAYEFMGTKSTYGKFVDDIGQAAAAFRALGIGGGDRVAICLPNIPQALISFYAINMIGAVSVMIHPLSADAEMEIFLSETKPKGIVTLNLLFNTFKNAIQKTGVPTVILAKIQDMLGPVEAAAVAVAYRGKGKITDPEARYTMWRDFFKSGAPRRKEAYTRARGPAEPASILYSGGTSGMPKGIMLSSLNFNALALQIGAQYRHKLTSKDSMIAILPLFHGFGLGCCIHAILLLGARFILVPRFSSDSFAELIMKKKPSLIAGPPSLYEALLRNKRMRKAELSCLKGAFSGGDKLPLELKRRFDAFLRTHNASISLREGYGLTESVTACILTPEDAPERAGCVGIPLSDMLVQIVEPGTTRPVPVGRDGEICVFGPSVMLGYLGDQEETDKVLVTHPDGRVWLHTGDMGWVDENGFVYFRQRIKRILKISGYPVYPSMIEEIVNSHPAVNMSCAVAVSDDLKMSRVKLYVQLKAGARADEETRRALFGFCREKLNKWSQPKEIEFRENLPCTKIGKIDYQALAREAEQKS